MCQTINWNPTAFASPLNNQILPYMCKIIGQHGMSDLQLQNVDFSASGVKCEKTVQIKVLVKNIAEQTLQGSVMSDN